MNANTFFGFMGAAGSGTDLPNIGDSFEGGYYAGLISHTADGVATHALIVAPKATGCGGDYYGGGGRKGLNSPGTATTNNYDGAANTAVLSGDIITFVTGLSIGGYTDWYLPAIKELEIAYYNLKPGTQSNNTSYGANAYSVPELTSNYTATDPGQTTATDFITVTGSEAFWDRSGNYFFYHQSSTAASSTNHRYLDFRSGFRGSVNATNTTLSYCAFRKVAV